ncbi:SRPBCC family protein [bacterium CPR1]|nr:SRPBCC family protein [bacterium CPR1]
MKGLRRSRTHSVSIPRSPHEVFSFLTEVENWPRWAVLTVRRVRRDGEGWVFEGVEGELALTAISRPEVGLFDYELGGWSVAMRVLPNGDGSEVVATFLQPEGMQEREFEQAVNVRERELKALKVVLC